MLLVALSAFILSTYGGSFDCNHIDMGFNVIHPTDTCVIGKRNKDTVMSMEHQCIDGNTVESRIYESNMNCRGSNYQIDNTFDCSSNSTFVSCDCSHSPQSKCSTVTDVQWTKEKNGECDTSKMTDHRTYIVKDNEVPKSFTDSNCFQRKASSKS